MTTSGLILVSMFFAAIVSSSPIPTSRTGPDNNDSGQFLSTGVPSRTMQLTTSCNVSESYLYDHPREQWFNEAIGWVLKSTEEAVSEAEYIEKKMVSGSHVLRTVLSH